MEGSPCALGCLLLVPAARQSYESHSNALMQITVLHLRLNQKRFTDETPKGSRSLTLGNFLILYGLYKTDVGYTGVETLWSAILR